MGGEVGKPAVPKRQTFVQIEREALVEWANFTQKNPTASALLQRLTSLMDKQGAVAVSHKTLAKLCHCTDRTIRRAIEALENGRWLQVVKLGAAGTVNAYIINSRVAWCDLRDNRKMAIFSARIVADVEEQSEQTLRQDKLRRIPLVHPPEEALPAGEWPNGAQIQLPGLERVATGQPDENTAE
jgi:Helix-turn-helix domain